MSFQPDAFQQDGFQRGPLEPRPLVPTDAFQGDAFQAGIYVATGPQAPTITVQPQSQSISVGGTANLSVTATGDAPLTYQWYEGNSGDTSNPLVGEVASTIAVSPGSTTSYWVRVSNVVGDADSNTATVTVSTSTVVPAGKPGKGRKRKRYLVEIDGETFDVDSPDEARRVLSIAKEALQEQIEQPVKKAKNGKLPVNKPRIRVTGLPGPELKEIVQAIAGIRDEISQMYRDAARTAEIAYLIAKKRKQDDEEAILLLM